MKSVLLKLNKIQTELKAPKGQMNKFGNYKYRSCEDIMEAVKPLLADLKCVLPISDKVNLIGDRYYIEATATLIDCESGESYSVTASAREEESKKGMDGSQVTGASSSYARKYALNGLLDIDDTKDSDATNTHGKDEKIDSQADMPKEERIDPDSETHDVKPKTAPKAEKQIDTPAEAEAEIDKIKSGLINKVQIASIEGELQRTGVKSLQICKQYNVATLGELNFGQWKDIMARFETTPNKPAQAKLDL